MLPQPATPTGGHFPSGRSPFIHIVWYDQYERMCRRYPRPTTTTTCLKLARCRALNLLTIQCRAPAGSRQRHARNSRTTITTTTTGLAGFFARGITWARARRRAKRKECTSAPNRLATPATTVATITCGDSQTCAMTALDCTPFASTGATPNQVTAGAASVSCVSSAGKAETMGQL